MTNNHTKIIICTTFRDFNGGVNDKIQSLFLESLNNQKYKNWELVVTSFGEKKVKQELANYKIPHKFYASKPGRDYRFSLSEVLYNGVCRAKDKKSSILIWTTADVILDKCFLNVVLNNVKDDQVASSHPHTLYQSISDYSKERSYEGTPDCGIDLIIFGKRVWSEKLFIKLIKKYKFKNWGVFEHFLVSLGILLKADLVNLWGFVRIKKIENDRRPNSETESYFKLCTSVNGKVFNRFLDDFGLSREFRILSYCSKKFMLKMPIRYYIYFRNYYIRKKIKVLQQFIIESLYVVYKRVCGKK